MTVLRSRRVSVGSVRISPPAWRETKSWNRAVNGVCRACAGSTCASPSTSRRTCTPRFGAPLKWVRNPAEPDRS